MNHTEFVTVAHEARDWVVDCRGNFLRSSGDALETVAKPDSGNTWTCTTCGCEAKFENGVAVCPREKEVLPTLEDLESATTEEHEELLKRINKVNLVKAVRGAERSLNNACLSDSPFGGIEDAWATLNTVYSLFDKGYMDKIETPLDSPF